VTDEELHEAMKKKVDELNKALKKHHGFGHAKVHGLFHEDTHFYKPDLGRHKCPLRHLFFAP
jgi:hypothetical protein